MDATAKTEGADRWLSPPQLQGSTLRGGEIVLTGEAVPEARVLASGSGAAHGANADADGQFELAVPRPPAPTLLTIETQQGDLRARLPGRVLITPQAQAILMAPGRPSRLLSADSGTVVVDFDGSVVVVSGRGARGREVGLSVDGAAIARTSSGADGTFLLGPAPMSASSHRLALHSAGEPPVEIAIAPLTGPLDSEIATQSADGVLSASWQAPGGGLQRLWLVGPGR